MSESASSERAMTLLRCERALESLVLVEKEIDVD